MVQQKGSVLLILVGICCLMQNVVSDDPEPPKNGDDGANCLEACLSELQQRAPRLDAATVLSIGHIRSANRTVMCPRYDARSMETTCGPYRNATLCFAKCPDGQMKTLSTSGFAPLQLVCIDRSDEFEKYMPCLSENCVSIESTCQRKCGSFDDLSKDIMQLLRQIRGTATNDQTVNTRVDPANVTMIISKACDSIECFAECSQNPTTAKCGQEAYNLEMDTIWTIFASMTQSMSSIGLTTPWPESCKSLSSKFNPTSSTSKPKSGLFNSGTSQGGNETRSNSVDQFIQKKPSQDENGNATNQNVTVECIGAACGSASEKSNSIFAFVFCLLVALAVSVK